MFRRFLFLLVALSTAGVAAEPTLKDPMRPYQAPPASKKPSGAWRLTTIVRNGDRQVAVINGQAVRVGDTINGARVEAIEPWEVRLKRGDQDIVIPLRRAPQRDDTIEREAKP